MRETADGFASGGSHDARLRITGPIADLRVQIMRSIHEAIMVGIETALIDDPALTVRLHGLDRKPLRVVLDTHLRLPERSRLAATAGGSDPGHRGRGGAGRTGLAAPGPRRDDRAGPADRHGHVDLHLRPCGRSRRAGSPACSARADLVAARLIALKLADEVALITAEKPLGRAGVPALAPEARAALLDRSRYNLVETVAYGPDAMRLWERLD